MKAYMTVSCKVGAYNKVLNELVKMNLSKKDIFLLFGPVDILIQFCGLKDLDEFINNWFNPIRAITTEGTLIDRTQTFIVISEGRPFREEPYAFLFLKTQPRNLEKVQESLQNMPQVLSADTVFGPYDLICAVRAKNRIDLHALVARIKEEVPHIQGVVTEIVTTLY